MAKHAWCGRALAAVTAVACVTAVLAVALVPRGIASGRDGDVSWQVLGAPGLLAPRVIVEVDGHVTPIEIGGTPPARLEDTEVVRIRAGTSIYTVVAGPTPRGVASVRHVSRGRAHGEALVRRVAWRRIHVAVLPGDVTVTQLVGIDDRGGIVESRAGLGSDGVSASAGLGSSGVSASAGLGWGGGSAPDGSASPGFATSRFASRDVVSA